MPFSQATITRVYPPRTSHGETRLKWASTSPAGTWFQVYRDGNLATQTRRQRCTIPALAASARFDVGTVATGEQYTDFSASLPSAPSRRVRITWQGGTFLDPSGKGDVAGFRVFGSDTPGGPVDYTKWADIPAYAAVPTDGWSMGGYGSGVYGSAGASYEWESGPLYSGIWAFAVAAVDSAGNLGTVASGFYAIAVPPRPPSSLSLSLLGYGAGPYGGGSYGYGGYGGGGYGGPGGYGQSIASLTWQPSPG